MSKKSSIIFVGVDNEVIELTGEDKKLYLEDEELRNQEIIAIKQKQEELNQIKISAYKKLGLTDEEIAAIL